MHLIGPLSMAVDDHWALMPEAIRRIYRFVEVVGSDQDPKLLAQTFRAAFASGIPSVPMWLWADGGQVCGHLLAWVDEKSNGSRALFVGQVWTDRALSDPFRAEIVASVDATARRLGATTVEGWCERPGMIRLYRRFGLADPYMTAVRRRVESAR